MENRRKSLFLALIVIFFTTISIHYLPQGLLYYEYQQTLKKEIDCIIAQDQMIDWVPQFNKWQTVSGYQFNNNHLLYRVNLSVEGRTYSVILNTRLLNSDRTQLVNNPKFKTRPAIFGTLVKYTDGTYGLSHLQIKILSNEFSY